MNKKTKQDLSWTQLTTKQRRNIVKQHGRIPFVSHYVFSRQNDGQWEKQIKISISRNQVS